jgi:molybdate transport system regulatory protein
LPARRTDDAHPQATGAPIHPLFARPPMQVKGSLWLSVDGEPLGGHGRMALLRAVAEHGSITQAARAFGMSYKAAWDAIDHMNQLAGTPLVSARPAAAAAAARASPSTGERVVERYEQLDAVHQRFVRLLADGAWTCNTSSRC